MLFLSLALLTDELYGQQITSLLTKDGLPQSFVSGITQDKKGFLWIATRNGLARYDGVSFKLFQHDPENEQSLISNQIICLKYIDNILWIEYNTGDIDRFDPGLETFTHYDIGPLLKHNGRKLLSRGWTIYKNELWALEEDNKLVSYSFDSGALLAYDISKNQDKKMPLIGISQVINGKIWMVGQNGMVRFDCQKKEFTNYLLPRSPHFNYNPVTGSCAVDLHMRRNGELMWGDAKAFYFFSPKTMNVHTFSHSLESGIDVMWINELPNGDECFENNGKLYQYNDSTGLKILNKSLWQEGIGTRAFFVDKTGLLWVGTNARGLFKIDFNTPVFPSFWEPGNYPRSLIQNIFHKSIEELFGWTKSDNEFSLPGYHLRTIYDRNGRLWIGLKKNVICFDLSQEGIKKLPPLDRMTRQGELGIGIKGVTFLQDGRPVVAGFNGNIFVYNEEHEKWNELLPLDFLRKKIGSQLVVSDICNVGDSLWITTESDGVLLVDVPSKNISAVPKWLQDSLSNDQLLGICPDPQEKRVLWIGSYAGLLRFDTRTLSLRRFTTKDGLPDNTVYAIQDDAKGHLWFSTNKGICRFGVKTYDIRVFQSRYGLPGDEFNRFHSMKLPDGRISFGGPEGWTVFTPSKIQDDDYHPETCLTGLKVNNVTIDPSLHGDILTKPIAETDHLRLSYKQNFFTLYFAGMEFTQPQDINYRYQLVGIDNYWVESGHNPFANYTNIPPGTYRFKVSCTNASGKWSDKISTITITIMMPWWSSWYAYLFYTIIIFLTIRYLIRQQRIKMELRQSILLKKQEVVQLQRFTKMKSRFFANITHDLRTPLTLILSPIPRLKEAMTGKPEVQRLESIEKNAENLLSYITDLLNFSKVDWELGSLNESIGDISEFTMKLVDCFQDIAKNKGIRLDFLKKQIPRCKFDHDKLKRILLNLISNSLKFTNTGGMVKVELECRDEKEIVFKIMDSGIGMAESAIPYVFDRFYQEVRIHDSGQPIGSGIGLSVVKTLVDAMHGNINVESEIGKGSTFTFSIPFLPFSNGMAEEAPLEASSTAGKHKPLLLLVDDNREIMELIKESMAVSYNFLLASNGNEGLEIAKRRIPDLIITDVMMPIMDGLELCSAIHNNDTICHIPIIMLTAKDGLENRMEGLQNGADEYLEKPFHLDELELRISNLLAQQSRLRKNARKKIVSQEMLANEKEKIDPLLEKFYKAMSENMENPMFGVEEMSVCLHISRVQLHRKLKTLTGLTATELMRNYRLNKAAILLKNGATSSEAAYKTGFDSASYFSKCFKELYGVSPSSFC